SSSGEIIESGNASLMSLYVRYPCSCASRTSSLIFSVKSIPAWLLIVPIACSAALRGPALACKPEERAWPLALNFAETSVWPAARDEAEVGTVWLLGRVLSADFFEILEAALPDFFTPALETLFRAFDLTIILAQNREPS